MTTKNTTQATADRSTVNLREVGTARAILRAIILAVAAQDADAIAFDGNPGPERWSPAVGDVASRLRCVRDAVIEVADPPALDWYTPLTLVEALDAALWQGSGGPAGGLEGDDLSKVAQAAVEALDRLLEQCVTAGLSLPTQEVTHG